MEKEMVNQVQEAQIVPYRRDPRRNTPKDIPIKLKKTKHKERKIKAAREKHIMECLYGVSLVCYLTADLSAETLQARRERQDTERGKSTTKSTVPGKDLIQNWWRNKKLFRQAKVQRIQYH